MSDTIRAEFERLAETYGWNIERNSEGDYINMHTSNAFEFFQDGAAWQAKRDKSPQGWSLKDMGEGVQFKRPGANEWGYISCQSGEVADLFIQLCRDLLKTTRN